MQFMHVLLEVLQQVRRDLNVLSVNQEFTIVVSRIFRLSQVDGDLKSYPTSVLVRNNRQAS